ncbi:hypothetical protein OCAR_5424 [Afipia carboxidovorans OM5]|nr:hypothetical protein OCAR_5424 [Afipia carboxidovorans OM5]
MELAGAAEVARTAKAAGSAAEMAGTTALETSRSAKVAAATTADARAHMNTTTTARPTARSSERINRKDHQQHGRNSRDLKHTLHRSRLVVGTIPSPPLHIVLNCGKP